MTKNLLLEPFADGVEIDEVDFMECPEILDFGSKFGKSLRKKCGGPEDSDINVGVGVGRTFGPRTEPEDLNASPQYASGEFGHFTRDLSRSSDQVLRNHWPSVSVLAMMSTR
jgi:hypothetical protein